MLTRDIRKCKIEDTPSVPAKKVELDSLFVKVQSCWTDTDEITEEEGQFQVSKRRMILGAHWAEKLQEEKENTSVTDSAHIEVSQEANPDAQAHSTSDIAHIGMYEILISQIPMLQTLMENIKSKLLLQVLIIQK